MNTQHLLGIIAVCLAAWATLASYLAWYFYVHMKDYRRANDIRKQMIEETRAGKPPFILDPGVKVVREDSTPNS